MKNYAILLSVVVFAGCATPKPHVPDKIYTVGVDTNCVPLQQVEWLYTNESLADRAFPIWAGTPLLVVDRHHDVMRVEVYESSIPSDWSARAGNADKGFVTGWIHVTNAVVVSTDEWDKHFEYERLNAYLMPNKAFEAIGDPGSPQPQR